MKQKNKETERHEGRRRDGERWKDEAGETGDSRKNRRKREARVNEISKGNQTKVNNRARSNWRLAMRLHLGCEERNKKRIDSTVIQKVMKTR